MSLDPTIIRSAKRRRTVSLHVEADGRLTVLAPTRTSLKWIHDFIREKAGWIARRQKALRERHERPRLVLQGGSLIEYYGNRLQLRLHKTQQNEPPSCCFDAEHAQINLFLANDLDEATTHREIITELTLWYKKQARRIFTERTAYWAGQMNMSGYKMILTGPEKRWGSCNSKNEIRLNWRLILAEPALVDYVIVHELAHIPHKNHGKMFKNLLKKFLPDMRQREQALKIFEKSPFLSLFRTRETI